MLRVAFALLAAVIFTSSWPQAARAQQSAAVEDRRLDIRLDHRSFSLVARVFRPAGEGSFPLVVINHGTPSGDLARLRAAEIGSLDRPARWFAEHGYIVVVALRPGFGQSEGPFMERTTPCANRDYVHDGRTTADVEAALVESAKALPGVDAHRVILVGHSAGGFGAMALADAPPTGVVAVINFAGGKGANDGSICSGAARLAQAGAVFGRANRVPQLWLYAPNDKEFPPSVARPLYDAYREGSKPPVKFVALPPVGDDGHLAFIGDPDVWAAPVLAFLGELGAKPQP
jgi:dienelactone hydrolase